MGEGKRDETGLRSNLAWMDADGSFHGDLIESTGRGKEPRRTPAGPSRKRSVKPNPALDDLLRKIAELAALDFDDPIEYVEDCGIQKEQVEVLVGSGLVKPWMVREFFSNDPWAFDLANVLGNNPPSPKVDKSLADVLGTYSPGQKRITLYVVVCRMVAHSMGVDAGLLAKVVLAHEAAHAVTHLGRDEEGAIWANFGKAPSETVELFAQIYDLKHNEAQGLTDVVGAFRALADRQSTKYNTWRDLDPLPVAEVNRRLLEARREWGAGDEAPEPKRHVLRRDAAIDNPVINSPFTEPGRYFKFDDEGITNVIVEGRRPSSYFLPIAQPRKREKQTRFETEWTVDRVKLNEFINEVRARVEVWRKAGYPGVTRTTKMLLDYWNDPRREKGLFFCQKEALETIIYITEAAEKGGDVYITNELAKANAEFNASLPRVAMKMATGSGKTVVMAMLIAWQALNKLAAPQDARFSDAFLVVTPGITIKDRLRVLLPTDLETYYRQRDIVPSELMEKLCQAKIVVTNFHALQLREKVDAPKLTKSILGNPSAFTETPDEMVRRVCRELGNKKNVVVLNDEAHHCYFRRNGAEDAANREDAEEPELKEEDARVWINGLAAVNDKLGIRSIYDLSATPFFLKGSGHPEGQIFPWVVSDFSLIDAIESGIVKIPRVPVSDNSMAGDLPTYRNIWPYIMKKLPRKGRKDTEGIDGEPKLPMELEGALRSLYGNYATSYKEWETKRGDRLGSQTPPVMIVVCNNTSVSKLVYDFIAGWETQVGDTGVVQAGALDIFRNDDGQGGWLPRPNTILVDSEQLESGAAMSDQFRRIAAREIEEFKNEYRARYPGRDVDQLTSEDILREVMNTVGKPGKLGENIKCVVSVSMLTEGWDAQTVTHVLGVRAFGTQLLCEQVVGRALRRMSYATDERGMFLPEYAEVYGVPFSFIPAKGKASHSVEQKEVHRVKALPERVSAEIRYPKLLGYKYEFGEDKLTATFNHASRLALSTQALPTETEMDPIVGQGAVHDLRILKETRESAVAFYLAKKLLETKFRDGDGNLKPWLFPQLLDISRRWLSECVDYKSDTFPQMLLLAKHMQTAVDKLYSSIILGKVTRETIKPIFRPYDSHGSTKDVNFDTTRPVYATKAEKCHVSHVVCDTNSWEQKMAQTLEDMPEVIAYVKNHKLGFSIPYTIDGEEHQYLPDFVAMVNYGQEEILYLIIEVTGESREDKTVKVNTARNLWVPAVNNHGGFGRWDFIEVRDPWNAKNQLRKYIDSIREVQ